MQENCRKEWKSLSNSIEDYWKWRKEIGNGKNNFNSWKQQFNKFKQFQVQKLTEKNINPASLEALIEEIKIYRAELNQFIEFSRKHRMVLGKISEYIRHDHADAAWEVD